VFRSFYIRTHPQEKIVELHEYQAKARMRQFGIAVPPGTVVVSPEAAEAYARELDAPVVIKAQALTGKRAVVSEVRMAQTPHAAAVYAQELLTKTFNHWPVSALLVEPYFAIGQELYLSIFLDQRQRCMLIQASAKAGLKATYENMKETLVTEQINPVIGLQHYQTVILASGLNLRRIYWAQFSSLCKALYHCALESDAYLAEITRLGLTGDERFMVLGARMAIDDAALYRQQELVRKRDTSGELLAEVQARSMGIDYMKMNGEIACIANGNGLVMILSDLVRDYGLDQGVAPDSMLNLGARTNTSKIEAALRLVLADPDVKVILLNIYASTTRTDDVAAGLVRVYRDTGALTPIVLHLQGHRLSETMQILNNADLPQLNICPTLEDAAHRAVTLAKEFQEA
jgi:succinyl-CoA synthetase beta subunit